MWQKTYCETRGIWGSKISEYFARVGVLKFEVPDRGLISANWPHVSMLGRNREGARHTFHQICMESTSGGLAEMRPSEGLKLGSIGKIPYFRGPQINTSLLYQSSFATPCPLLEICRCLAIQNVWRKTPYNLYGRDRKPPNMAVPPIQNRCGPPPGPAGRSTPPSDTSGGTAPRERCPGTRVE